MVAGVHPAVLRNQVDVLDDDHGRLEGAGHRAGGADQPQGVPRELHDGDVAELTGQVAHRVGLSHPRWSVEQETSLEVLACRKQPLAVLRDADDLPTDRRQGLLRQNHVVCGQRGAAVELQGRAALAEHVSAEGDDLPAVHVVDESAPADLSCDDASHPRAVPYDVQLRGAHAALGVCGEDEDRRSLPHPPSPGRAPRAPPAGSARPDRWAGLTTTRCPGSARSPPACVAAGRSGRSPGDGGPPTQPDDTCGEEWVRRDPARPARRSNRPARSPGRTTVTSPRPPPGPPGERRGAR